jgi:hypothetical protein
MESATRCEILALGPKRMAGTLLAYAKPLTERLPRDYTLHELRATLAFAAAVWNAVLIHDIREAVAHLTTNMPPRLRVPPARVMAAIRRLLARRYRHFGSDPHFVVAVNVYDEAADFSVAAIGICPDPSCCGPQARA